MTHDSQDARLLYLTVGTVDEANQIAARMVEERLAACGNVLAGMRSVYRWRGKIEYDDEAVLILKTRTELVQRAIARAIELHSYECPCVLELPVAGGNPAFLSWIREQTQLEGEP